MWGIPSSSANAFPCSSVTHTLAVLVAFVSNQDLVNFGRCVLFDVRMPSSDVWHNGFRSEFQIGDKHSLLNDFSSDTSYTSNIPIAPR